MTIHVLMPVHNRVSCTESMLECLRTQIVDEPLSIVVIDDGSTDETADFLCAQNDIAVLKGDGSLWWGGAVDLALRTVIEFAKRDDWVLFVNNDTKIDCGFVQTLLDAALTYAPAAIGSVVLDVDPPHRTLSIGPVIKPWRLKVSDLLEERYYESNQEIFAVDALSGRCVLYPISVLESVGGLRPWLLPHYLADYELALRVKHAGYKLLVSNKAIVFSANEFGNSYKANSLWEHFFSVRSPSFLPALVGFWWSASTPLQRLTFLLRVILKKMVFILRSKK